MSAQQMRDRLEKGMRVDVIIRPTPSTIKRRAGVVVDVVRAAAQVRVEGETQPRMIRFSDLEIPSPAPIEKPPAPVARIRPADNAIAALPTKHTPPTPAEFVRSEKSSLDAWLDMGRELEADLEAETELHRAEKAALEAERAEIDRALDAATERYAKTHKALDAIRTFRKGAGA